MQRTSSSVGLRPGPLARRMLARRRRWLRWAAIGLAALTTLCAAAQLHQRSAPRRSGPPASGVLDRHPARRFYGVAELVPPGMRAVNLLVPASATFEGRLTPSSRVDVLAAFDLGQDRSVRRVLASGIVLHVTPQPAVLGASPTPMPSPAAERFGATPVAELALAVPAASEREVVMAQAFGRVFVVVEPAVRGVSHAGVGQRARDRVTAPTPDDALSLRRYLGLPAEGSRAAATPAAGTIPLVPSLAGVPPPVLPWPAPPGSRAGTVGGAAADPNGVTVEIIEGTARTFAEVRR